jgi:hypothetical protein
MQRFPGIILGVVLFGFSGGTLALCGSIVVGASLMAAVMSYTAVGMMSALAFVAVANHNWWGA